MPPETLGQHRHLWGHAEADHCCGKSLIGSALVGFSVRQHAQAEYLSIQRLAAHGRGRRGKLCQTCQCRSITYGDFVELLVRDDSMCTDHLRPPLSPIPASCLAAGEELRVRASVHANVPASRPRESTVRRNEIVRGTTRHDNGADTDRRAHRRCVVRPCGGCRFLLPMSITAGGVRDPV